MSQTTTGSSIETSREEGALWVTLNRPPSNNLSQEMLRTLSETFTSAGTDPSVRCVVLASALPKYFAAGLDLEEILSLPEAERGDAMWKIIALHRTLAAVPKPTIAAIGGYAMAGGWVLAMACDFRLMAEENGRIALNEVRLGISPTGVLISRMLKICSSRSVVRDMVLRGETLKAQEALQAGLVDRLVPAAELRAAAASEAKSLSKLPPQAYASIKAALYDVRSPDNERLFKEAMEDSRRLFSGPEAREGMAAMREKRRPRWE